MNTMPSNPELSDIVTAVIADFDESVSQLADMLQAVQKKLGYIPPSTIPVIASKAKVSRPEVYKVVELSPSLKLTPAGDHKLYICNADNCCMQGGKQIMEHAQKVLGIHEFQTTPDQKIRLESFRCFGNCSMSPNVMVDGRVYGMMDNQQLDLLIAELKS
jgi:NADH:ubiquinone oxidoreductase subunit E